MGSEVDDWATEPIAIVGLSCKFAGDASSPEKLWQLLKEGRSAWSEIPSSRFNLKGFYHPDHERPGTVRVNGAHFIEEDPGLFDAPFFSYSAETAAALDPQFRLQLESVYEALENAGLSLTDVAGSKTSVYAGAFSSEYRDALLRDEANLPRFLQTGTGSAFASNRISHFFDFQGASMTIDTGCSTTLVALHQAVQSLRQREADMSVVGGSNLMLTPDMFMGLGSVGFLSPDGKSYAFDSRANGYGRGEGVATLVVKRLSDALKAGDPIRAVIRETGLNQDGKSETITSPSQEAQETLMRDCYRKAGLDPRKTQYFEAHGTGTAKGDPIEMRAVASVFKPGRESDQALRVGSVKTNIGHTETTSGLAAVIKVVLALEKGIIPPTVNFNKLNPELLLDEWRMSVVTEQEQWPHVAPGQSRRASVNNFGYGGTNSHVILEYNDSWQRYASSLTNSNHSINGVNGVNGVHYLNGNGHTNGHTNGHANGHTNGHTNGNGTADSSEALTQVLMLSARDEQACQTTISNVMEYLQKQKAASPDVDTEKLLKRLIYTVGQRRTLFPWVAAHPVPYNSGLDDVIAALETPGFRPTKTSRSPRIGMVFTGQGAQWNAMGRELLHAYPVFKSAIDEAEDILKDLGAEWSLLEELSRDAKTTRVNDTALSIPICVALQIALIQLLRSWGINPTAVTSHSSGEISAAYAVGAMSFRRAMAAGYYRSAVAADKLKGAVKGAMLAVGLGEDAAQDYLDQIDENASGKAIVACINSPASVTIAGDAPAVQEMEKLVKADGIFARLLRVETGYHSHHMSPLAAPYLESLRAFPADENIEEENLLDKIAFSSAVTGDRVTEASEIADPRHWIGSLVQPVQFVDAFTDMILGDMDPSGTSVDVLVEVGPHTALGGPIKEILAEPEFGDIQIPYFGCLVRKTSAVESMQTLAANLIRQGVPVDLAAVNSPNGRQSSISLLTDLPSYPWNHSHRHWVEPRFAQAVRVRDRPVHDLLGSLIPGANPEAPVWRNVVKIAHAPWLRDHMIQGNILYPGAGYICLAIEGMKEKVEYLDKKVGGVSGYQLREIDLLQALVVPDNDEGIEIQTSLTPAGDKNIGTQGWMRFEIHSVLSDNRWTQHATGLIAVEASTHGAPVTAVGLEAAKAAISGFAVKGHTRGIDPADFFAQLRALGVNHGPKFRNIRKIVQAGRTPQSVAQIDIANTALPNDLPREHVIHPTTLDSIVTGVYSALPGAGAQEDSAKIPRSIERLWLSTNIAHEAGQQLKSCSSLTHNDSQGLQADVCVVAGENEVAGKNFQCPLLSIDGFRFQSLGRGAASKNLKPWEKDIYSKVEWAADLSLGLPTAHKALMKKLCVAESKEKVDIIACLQRVCFYFIQDALAALSEDEISKLQPPHDKYFSWMQDQVRLASEGNLGSDSASWAKDNVEERQRRIALAATQSTDGQVVCRLGPRLQSILKGEQDLSELVKEDDLLHEYYKNSLRLAKGQQQLADLLRAVVHKNPRANVLEIGAGTGATTHTLLAALGSVDEGGPLVGSWQFTNVSSRQFEEVKGRLSAWGDVLDYRKLDIEKDPLSQGFQAESYDIVIASDVKGTSKVLNHAVNIRTLLKPGGKLLSLQPSKTQLDAEFCLGLLSASVGDRTSDLEVKQALKDAGFGGVDIEVSDSNSQDGSYLRATVSTVAPASETHLTSDEIVIVTSSKAPVPAEWLEALKAAIAKASGSSPPAVHILETSPANTFTGRVCVFASEVAQPVLHNMDEASLEGLKAMTSACKGVLWLTRGGAAGSENPELSLAPGFFRSLRNEYVGRCFVTHDLDPKVELSSAQSVESVVTVLKQGFGTSDEFFMDDETPDDFEYAERDGVIMVPRIYKDMERNKFAAPMANDTMAEVLPSEPFYQSERPLCMQVAIPGLLDTLAFGDDVEGQAYLNGGLPADMVEIEPAAYGVNFRDVMAAMGQLRERALGNECSGIITRLGKNAAAQGFSVGDRVMAQLLGPLGSRARVAWHGVTHMPSKLSFEEAASLPVIFATAYISLVDIAGLEAGQSVLIHAAAGGVGQAAIMLAQNIGADIFVTVGSQEKRDLVKSQYGIPDDHIFNSRDTSFAPGIIAATSGRGVDVVLNSLAGPLLQASFDLLTRFGHFVEIGKRDVEGNSALEMEPFSRHVSFSVVDLRQLLRYKGPRMHRALVEVTKLFEQGVIKPVYPVTPYPIADAAKAFRLVQTGKHTGKVVLTVTPKDEVKVFPSTTKAKLSADASYVIVGGVGGLGRSVAHWMVDHGAKNLILLSRSAGDQSKSARYTQELEDAGSRVMGVSCDVADSESLNKALATCKEAGFPPVRGVIQAAVVFKDSVLEHMTMDHWNASLPPKVAGTWNLHEQFSEPNSLDFFVILSSNLGIVGLASQTNYTAGGAYEDALAHWRVARSLPATSIDFGGIKDVGHVQETAGVANRLVQGGHMLLSEDQVLKTVESAVLQPMTPQVVTAINSGPGHHWDRHGQTQWGRDARFLAMKYRPVRAAGGTGADDKKGAGSASLADKLSEASSQEDATRVVSESLAAKLAGIFMIPLEDIDLSKTPAAYGVDSLVAVELRNMLVLQAAAEVSIFNILQSASLAALAEEVASKSAHVQLG